MNAEGELRGQSCPRKAAGSPEVFLSVLFQIYVCFEAEVTSEHVPPQALFTDKQADRHTHTHKMVHLQGLIMMCEVSILFYLFRAIILLHAITKHLSSLPPPLILIQSESEYFLKKEYQ